MTTLHLHIGHDKTGSTYLQAAFTCSRAALEADGIHYPVSGDDARKVDFDTMTPVGNGRGLFASQEAFARTISKHRRETDRGVLFSSETLFDYLNKFQDFSFIPRLARNAGYDKVCILLFVRECVGHAVSVWQQHVKGWQGETAPLDDWLAHKYDRPIQLARLVQALSATDGIELQVSNYDHHKRQLIPVVERWLNLSPGVLQSGPRERLNRSLTAAEAALQRALNTHLGPCGKVFAFRLVNRLPDVPDDPPLPSLGAQDAARARLGSALEIVNSYLAPGEQLAFSFQRPPQTSNALLLTLEQLETIAEGIAHAVDRKVLKVSSQAQLPSLPRRIARRLRKMVRLPRGAAASAPIAIK